MSPPVANGRAPAEVEAIAGAVAHEAETPTARRRLLKSVAIPTEHGGWGLTLEPGLLGVLLAPSTAGLCLFAAAMVAFLVRTPLKLVAVDRRRRRWLPRTKLAVGVAAGELVVLAALVGGALVLAGSSFWGPLVVAAPLLVLAASFEVRSRGRRLVPELAGAIGVSAVAAMCVLAGGSSGELAAGAWLVMAARSVTSIPQVRAQVAQIHGRQHEVWLLALTDLVAVSLGAAAIVVDRQLAAGAVGVLALIALQRVWARQPPPRAVVIGIRQMALGFGLVIATALGALAIAS